jgi:hypothetical protein
LDGLTVGRIVHYRAIDATEGDDGVEVCHAAIVTRVLDAEGGLIDLTAFRPGDEAPSPVSHVRHDDETKPADTWHWPERA